MPITVGTIMKLIGEFRDILTTEGVFDAAGNFVNPVSAEAVAKAAADIERLLVAHGVTVQGNIEQAIQALPFILPLLGLK